VPAAETLARTRGSPRISARTTGSRSELAVDRRAVVDLRRCCAAGGASGISRRSGLAGCGGSSPAAACWLASVITTLIVVTG